jgi:molybdate transport system regulatory protein
MEVVMNESSPMPRVRIRVDFNAGCSVGPGKVALMEAIEREGSLTLAARNLAMSYRRAWLLLDDLNSSFATPMVETAVGGSGGGGARLTDAGHALVRLYRALEQGTTSLAARHMRAFRPRRKAGHAAHRRKPLALRGRARS